MYGPDGEVLYRPRGARCKGDPAPERARPERAERADVVERARRERAASVAPAAAPAAPRSTMLDKIEGQSSRKERCLWLDGRIAFKPEGVDCYAR